LSHISRNGVLTRRPKFPRTPQACARLRGKQSFILRKVCMTGSPYSPAARSSVSARRGQSGRSSASGSAAACVCASVPASTRLASGCSLRSFLPHRRSGFDGGHGDPGPRQLAHAPAEAGAGDEGGDEGLLVHLPPFGPTMIESGVGNAAAVGFQRCRHPGWWFTYSLLAGWNWTTQSSSSQNKSFTQHITSQRGGRLSCSIETLTCCHPMPSLAMHRTIPLPCGSRNKPLNP